MAEGPDPLERRPPDGALQPDPQADEERSAPLRRRSRPTEEELPFDPLLEREREAKRQTPLDISIKVIGVAAFIVGVFLHGCVAMSILDDGGDSSAQVQPTEVPLVEATPTSEPAVLPTATALPDRDDCDEIRGTQYRSVTEREFFLANCTTSLLPPGANPAGGAPSRPG